VARTGERKGAWQPGEKMSLGTLKHRWEDNTKMYLQEVACRGMDWNALAQDRHKLPGLVNKITNLRVPQNAGNFLSG